MYEGNIRETAPLVDWMNGKQRWKDEIYEWKWECWLDFAPLKLARGNSLTVFYESPRTMLKM